MRALIQRVSQASITINASPGGTIAQGLLILLGVEREDQHGDLEWLINKCLELRIFEDAQGKMNQSLLNVGGDALIVSQFTLFGNVKKGNRPSFNRSATPELAIPLYEHFVGAFRSAIGHEKVITGTFGADMQVCLTNDGPVTLMLDSRNRDL